MNAALFRPSAMLRRKRCPGSLALESTVTQVEEDDEVRDEGRLLHSLAADPTKPRDGLKPSQLDLLLAVERAEAEFLETISKISGDVAF